MFKKLQILTIFAVISCTTPNTKRFESEWSDLERSGPISCSAWPMKESELDISNMTASSALNGSFIATTRMRNGSQLPVYAETGASDRVSSDDLKSFPIGRNAHVVALAEWDQEPVAFIIQNRNDRGWLEIRAVRDNKMVARMATPMADDVYSGKIAPSARGWWLQLNHSESDSSFVSVLPGKNGDWKFSVSRFKGKTRFASIAASASDSDAHVVEQAQGGSEDVTQFKLTRLQVSGDFKELGRVSVQAKSGIESWSAAVIGSRPVLAVVRGDSMIGQASLIITGISVSGGEPALAWNREFALDDVHLGEPVWLNNGTKALVGLMKWIDAEGALARVKVDAYGAELLPDVGVFEKGTVLAAGFLGAKDKGVGAFRHRDNELWKYKLCKLSL